MQPNSIILLFIGGLV